MWKLTEGLLTGSAMTEGFKSVNREQVVDRPYREYSAPWFGYRKVLKGGAWATRYRLAYSTYRNFFQPYRRDIFAGFRTCAV